MDGARCKGNKPFSFGSDCKRRRTTWQRHLKYGPLHVALHEPCPDLAKEIADFPAYSDTPVTVSVLEFPNFQFFNNGFQFFNNDF